MLMLGCSSIEWSYINNYIGGESAEFNERIGVFIPSESYSNNIKQVY